MARIVINGKFLGAGLNGVHRTAAHYASLLIAKARSAGHDVDLLAPRAFHDDAFPLLQPNVVKGRFGTGQGWEMLTLPRAARGALLVNFCNLAPVLHRNSVVMIHDAQTFLYPADYTGRQGSAYRALLPLIGRRARRILTVSEFARQSLAAHGVGTADKITAVHNGTDHILDTPADNGVLTQMGIAPQSYVMVLGSAKGYKNIRRVFDAMKDGPVAGLSLVVAGGPDHAAYEANGWRVPAHVKFTGFVSDAALRALYENAAIFAFPSQTEGFGLPPLEAMHCGAPVIAARAGAMPEVCSYGAVLVDPDDSQPWRAAIERIGGSPTLAADLRARGAARAATLGWDNAGDHLWQAIAPLI